MRRKKSVSPDVLTGGDSIWGSNRYFFFLAAGFLAAGFFVAFFFVAIVFIFLVYRTSEFLVSPKVLASCCHPQKL
jgi:hypothetical protein